jgi:small nuclear ribonucleoprotein (snRNP)-like protein
MTVLEQLVGKTVVVDLRSPFVCLGTLKSFDDAWLELRNADMHDLRDTTTSRELYVAEASFTGVKRNRKRVLVARSEVAAVASLEDVVHQ